MNLIKQFSFGTNLTALTNIVEEMQQREAVMPAGIDGLDCWPVDQRQAVIREFDRRVSKLSSIPRHVVTRELAKNAQLAVRMGRQSRAIAIVKLIELLVDRNAALSVDEFARSYA